MSELRRDPTTNEWVIIAPERAKRPKQIMRERRTNELPNWDASCPFCPGNENHTPPEVFRLPLSDQGRAWDVRVVPNQFAMLALDGDTVMRNENPFFHKRAAVGVHEVIIETPSHNRPMALMTYQQVEKTLIAYQGRYNVLVKNHQLQFITIFKNHGWASGTSLVHPHSQLVATPVISTYNRRKFDIAHDYYTNVGRCLYCNLLTEELEKDERIVAETKHFVVLHPYASRVPWETWIIPKDHFASFGMFPAWHLAELARVMKDTLLCLYLELDDPPFNLMFDTSITIDEEDQYYHWHVKIVPRLTTIAGFEIGTGIYITVALPEHTASLMKQAATYCSEVNASLLA